MVAMVVSMVLVVCAVGVWMVVSWSGGSGTSPESSRPTHEGPMTYSAERGPQVVADLVEVVGDTQFVRLILWPDSARAEAPTTPGATTTDYYGWRDGHAERIPDPPEPRDPEKLANQLFDVTTVDWTVLEGLAAQIPELTGIDEYPLVFILREETSDGALGDVVFHISVTGKRYSATVTADLTGQIVKMTGGAPGSPARKWASEHP